MYTTPSLVAMADLADESDARTRLSAVRLLDMVTGDPWQSVEVAVIATGERRFFWYRDLADIRVEVTAETPASADSFDIEDNHPVLGARAYLAGRGGPGAEDEPYRVLIGLDDSTAVLAWWKGAAAPYLRVQAYRRTEVTHDPRVFTATWEQLAGHGWGL